MVDMSTTRAGMSPLQTHAVWYKGINHLRLRRKVVPLKTRAARARILHHLRHPRLQRNGTSWEMASSRANGSGTF